MDKDKTSLPIINQTYDYFDDGKINESRLYKVTIKEIIPFSEIDNETLKDWKKEVEQCYWLYSKETDFFIKGILKLSDDEDEDVVFVRTINHNFGWFSLGYWGGRLDVDGSLQELM